MTPSDPTRGRPAGEHRVVAPAGASPIDATHLDAFAELWDGEVRLALDAVVLRPAAHRGWVDRLRPDPTTLRAALVDAVAERGGIGTEGDDATFTGRITAVGRRHPHPVAVGERVAVAAPAGALPAFLVPADGWDGGAVVPVEGHAVVPASAVTVPIGDAPAALGAVLADVADVPAVLGSGARLVVAGADHPATLVAIAVAAAAMRDVTVVARSLAEARLARALGAAVTAIVAPDGSATAADQVRDATGDRWPRGRADLAVVADPVTAAPVAALAPTVQVLAAPSEVGAVAGAVLRHAAAAGGGVALHAGRGPVADRGAALRRLVASTPPLDAALRWRAGLGPMPGGGSEEVA